MNHSKAPAEANLLPLPFRFLGLTPADLVLIVILMIGFGLRIWLFLQNPSLSFDEALLVLNIRDHTFLELLKPLDASQAAPYGFLLSQKAIITLLGNRDILLRLLPLFFGLAGLILMARVARIYNQAPGAWVALGLFSITFSLLYFSYIVKQYIGDVFFTLLLLYLAPKCLGADQKPADFIKLLSASVVAIWFSHAIVFVLFGILLALSLDHLLSKNWRALFWVGMIALVAFFNFLLNYFLSLRHIAVDPVMTDYWDSAFMPLQIWKTWSWLGQTFRSVIEFPLGLQFTLVCSLLIWIGLISLIWRNWRFALMLLAPAMAALAASAFHKYPFGNRLILFLVPIFFLILGEGIDRVFRLTGRIHKAAAVAVWVAIVISLFYHPLKVVVADLRQPSTAVGIKPTLAYLSQHYQGELIYIYYGAIPAFRYYAPFYGLENSSQRIGVASRKKPKLYREDLDSLAQNQRVWFVFAQNCNWCKVNEENYYLENLEQIGVRLDKKVYSGSSVYLYQIGKP